MNVEADPNVENLALENPPAGQNDVVQNEANGNPEENEADQIVNVANDGIENPLPQLVPNYTPENDVIVDNEAGNPGENGSPLTCKSCKKDFVFRTNY